LSLELYKKYKHKLAATAFKSMKAFKTTITEQREIKFTVTLISFSASLMTHE